MKKTLSFFIVFLGVCLGGLVSQENPGEILSRVVSQDQKIRQEIQSWQYQQSVKNWTVNASGKKTEVEEVLMMVRPRTESSFKILNPQKEWIHGGKPGDEWARKGRNIQRQLGLVSLQTLIDRFDFNPGGMEVKEGMNAYRFHLVPKVDFKPKSRIEKVMKEVEADLWVDLKDYSVIQVEAKLRKPVSVAWMFATIQELEFRYQTIDFPWGRAMSGFYLEMKLSTMGGKSMHHREVEMTKFENNPGQDLW